MLTKQAPKQATDENALFTYMNHRLGEVIRQADDHLKYSRYREAELRETASQQVYGIDADSYLITANKQALWGPKVRDSMIKEGIKQFADDIKQLTIPEYVNSASGHAITLINDFYSPAGKSFTILNPFIAKRLKSAYAQYIKSTGQIIERTQRTEESAKELDELGVSVAMARDMLKRISIFKVRRTQ